MCIRDSLQPIVLVADRLCLRLIMGLYGGVSRLKLKLFLEVSNEILIMSALEFYLAKAATESVKKLVKWWHITVYSVESQDD